MKHKTITIFSGVEKDKHPSKARLGKTVQFSNFPALNKFIVSTAWSPSVFKENVRKNENFLYADVMALDFDEGATPMQVSRRLSQLKLDFSITLTRNHLKKTETKSKGPRFRVVIPLEERIRCKRVFENTWKWLHLQFPEVDIQCKDPARFYFASTKGIWRKK